MADTHLRTAERRWRETGDRTDLLAYTRLMLRSGHDVPYDLTVQTTGLYSHLGTNDQGLHEFRHKTTGMIFVQIPAGEFMMGPCDATIGNAEVPQRVRRVFAEPFLLAKYPWTGREWHRVTGELPSHFPTTEMVEEVRGVTRLGDEPFGSEVRLELPDSDGRKWGDHPVESVSWDRCREVEDWINRVDFARSFNAPFWLDGRWVSWLDFEHGVASIRDDGEVELPVFAALRFPPEIEVAYQSWLWNEDGERVGFQLPTEAMWEYATRAGTTTRYPTGDSDADLEKIAWFGGEWDNGHKAVGLKEPNNWGLYDNCGNVFEWTRCMWQRNNEEDPQNGFIAHGETRPDPIRNAFLSDQAILSLVCEVARGPMLPLTEGESGSISDEAPATSDSEQPRGFSPDPTRPTTPTGTSGSTEEESSSHQPSSTEPSEDPRTCARSQPGSGIADPGEPGIIDFSEFTVPEGRDLSNLQPPNPDWYGTVTLDNLGGVRSDPTQPSSASTPVPRSSSDTTTDVTFESSRSTPSEAVRGGSHTPPTAPPPTDTSEQSGDLTPTPSEQPGEVDSSDPTRDASSTASSTSTGSLTSSSPSAGVSAARLREPQDGETTSESSASTATSATEPGGGAGSPDPQSGEGGGSTLTPPSSTSISPRVETEQASSSAAGGIQSLIRASFTRLTSPFRSLLEQGSGLDEVVPGATGQTPSTTEHRSSQTTDRPTGSDRLGGAGPDDPFDSSGSTTSTSANPSSEHCDECSSTETSSQRSGQQTRSTTPTTSGLSPLEEHPGISGSATSPAADTGPVESEATQHQRGPHGERGDADFPSLTRSGTISSQRSTERSSETSLPSRSESTRQHSAIQQTGLSSSPDSSDQSPSSRAETGSGMIERGRGGSIQNCLTEQQEGEPHGGRDSRPFGFSSCEGPSQEGLPASTSSPVTSDRRDDQSPPGSRPTGTSNSGVQPEPPASPPDLTASSGVEASSDTAVCSRTLQPQGARRAGATSGEHSQRTVIQDSELPGERGDPPFVSRASSESPITEEIAEAESTHESSWSESSLGSGQRLQDELWATVTSLEDSAGPATPPTPPSEILASIARVRTELLQERPGGAAASTPFGGRPGYDESQMIISGRLQDGSLNANRRIYSSRSVSRLDRSSATRSHSLGGLSSELTTSSRSNPSTRQQASSSTSITSTAGPTETKSCGAPSGIATRPPQPRIGQGPARAQPQVFEQRGADDSVIPISIGGRINYQTGEFELTSIDFVPGPSVYAAYPSITDARVVRGSLWTDPARACVRRRHRRRVSGYRGTALRPAWRSR